MCVLGAVLPARWLRICVFSNYVAIFAMSWDILSGYTGYVSFGHPFIFGLAGYTSAMLSKHLGLPLYATMPIGIGAGLGAGMLFFLPGLRLRGNYFCLVTLGWLIVIHNLMKTVRPDLTGGTRGLTNIQHVFLGANDNYWLSLGIMFAVALGLWYVSRSNTGAVFNAIRMDEDSVSTAGLNAFRFKLLAFTLSAVAGGLGGVFFTHYLGAISPESTFGIDFNLTVIIAALIGGQNTILGPISGAYFVTFLLEYLRPYLPGPPRFLAFSLIALFLYVFRTRGFYGIIQDVTNWYRMRGKKGVEYG